VKVCAQPRVAVISTGDELVQPAVARARRDLRTQRAFTRGRSTRRWEATFLGAVPDYDQNSSPAMRRALADSDMLVLSGGPSKARADLSHRIIISRLGAPGIIALALRLKPGKPLSLRFANTASRL